MNCKNDRDAVKYFPLLWKVYKDNPKKKAKNGVLTSKGLKMDQQTI